MYLIKKAIIRLDLNEFPFDFSDGYIDGSNQVLEPNTVISCGEYETVHEAVSEVDHIVYVSIDGENLIIEFEYIYDEDVCIKHLEFADFEGQQYKIDNDLYCPELANILSDKILEIKRQEFINDYGNATFKHCYSIELRTKDYIKHSFDWVVEKALQNEDSHTIEDSNGGDLELVDHDITCDICESKDKVVVFVYCECEKYIVVDHGKAVYSTDYLDDAISCIDNKTCQFVYDWKNQLFM